jgi:replication factor C subunit 2/4
MRKQEIGWTHMRILEGVGTLVQLGGLMARLCRMVCEKFDNRIRN